MGGKQEGQNGAEGGRPLGNQIADPTIGMDPNPVPGLVHYQMILIVEI